MVLVRVRQDDRQDVAVVEVAEVRQDQVDAEVLVTWKGKPGIDHEQLVGDLEDGHVLADLAQTAQRDHAQDLSLIAAV